MNNYYGPDLNTPQNQYPGSGGWYGDYYNQLSHLQEQKRKIKKLSISTGLCMIAFVALQVVLIFTIRFLNLKGYYEENMLFKNAADILLEVVCIFVPFLIAALLAKKESRSIIFNYEAPRSAKLFLSAVFGGFMICMAADIISGYFQVFLEQFGLNGDIPSMPTPTGVPAILLYIISISVTPALVEEFALRGVVMQPLRKFGDRFAIIISGAIFALLHGNATQTLFAFIVGATIGYFVIATGSIWTGIAIHFANNFFSVVFSLINSRSESMATSVYQIVLAAAFIVGIVAVIIFALDKKRVRLRAPESDLSGGQKFTAYVFTAPMIGGIILFLFSIVTALFSFSVEG